MKYLDGFRDPAAAAALRRRLQAAAAMLPSSRGPVRIMEVCGTHTMAIARYGIRGLLPPGIEIVSGPGCPVCVTPPGYLDAAIELAGRGVTVATFGDLLRVPGSTRTLAACRAAGGAVEVCYSPSVAVELARHRPGEVVFLGIGFETTCAPVITLVETARREGLASLSLLTSFKLVPPALHALLADATNALDAFLCPAHVSAIIGADAYQPIVDQYHVPCVIAGFEPLDILLGLVGIVEQVARGEARVDNQYSRVVKPGGNRKAQELMATYLQPADADWRGIGTIPVSGLGLRPAYAEFDAAQRFGLHVGAGVMPPGCRCGEVIKGKLRPEGCPLFGRACAPEHPVGPCMVSSEGSCAASFKYGRLHGA